MGLDDLARDRQAEAGILAKAWFGPVGIEALENALEGMGGNAGPVVVDDDLEAAGTLVAPGAPALRLAWAADTHGAASPAPAARLRKGAGIVDQIVEHLAEPRIMAEGNPVSGLPIPDLRALSMVRTTVTPSCRGACWATSTNALQQAARSTLVHVGARQFRVETRGVGNIADQPVEPAARHAG